MSTRWYPLYQKGNPQIRIFLPNLFMKLVKSDPNTPKNIIKFHVAIQMTKHDVKNYLEKIYNVPVMKVNTHIKLGEIKYIKPTRKMIKQDDIKVAIVHLPKDMEFEFPMLFQSQGQTKEDEIRENTIQNMREDHKAFLDKQKRSQGLPGWFNF